MAQITLGTDKFDSIIETIEKQTQIVFKLENLHYHSSISDYGNINSNTTEYFYWLRQEVWGKGNRILIKITEYDNEFDNANYEVTICRNTRNTTKLFKLPNGFKELIQFINKNK